MAKTPAEMEAIMVANLKQSTGKSIEEWVEIAGGKKRVKHSDIVGYLKDEHGMTHGYANLVAHRTLQSASTDAAPDDLVSTQYAGTKSGLRPIYDALVVAVSKFGADVEFAPKKSYVSLRRAKQFGLIQPSTATRVDVGINLKGVEPAGRLEASGTFNAMVSHRVKVSSVKEVDRQLLGWLRKAYDAAV